MSKKNTKTKASNVLSTEEADGIVPIESFSSVMSVINGLVKVGRLLKKRVSFESD